MNEELSNDRVWSRGEVLDLDKDPLIYLGLDIAVRRDTCALVGLCPIQGFNHYALWGHKIWTPTKGKPVNLARDVAPHILNLLESNRVVALHYDPYQAAAMVQGFAAEGHAHKLVEVNQGAPMVEAANTLHGLFNETKILMYEDPELESILGWTVAVSTERGWRIIKKKQSKPVDFTVSLAMAARGATSESGYLAHPSWSSTRNVRSALAIP